jgi:hypothetical protein
MHSFTTERPSMPDKRTLERARRDKQAGKSPSTQAGEFVREEMHHIRQGKHGARSPKQAIAIGLSKARRSGVNLPSPGGRSSPSSRRRRTGGSHRPSRTRSRSARRALGREGTWSATPRALSRHARAVAGRRSPADRSRSAKIASRTKGPRVRSIAARKAARTRSRSH